MKLKTLLLGSAATFMVVGGAQAADLTIAEPVDYVRVCDAIGDGYWYIPGTDTCLKIGGYVQFDVNFHANGNTITGSNHSASWDFVTEASVTVTAKSMTEFGILTGFLDMRGKWDNASGAAGGVALDTAYLELGPVLAGHVGSTYDYGGGFSDQAWRSDSKTDQIRLTWAMSGFGLMLGIEDPRDRWGSALPVSYSMPDIIAAITASQGAWDGKLSAGVAQLAAGSGGTVWGVNLGVTIALDSLAPGDQFRINGSVGTGRSFVGSPVGAGSANGVTQWSVFASFQHFWSPTLSTAITGTYVSGTTAAAWGVGGKMVWTPVTGFDVSGEGKYTVVPVGSAGVWSAKIRLKRYW